MVQKKRGGAEKKTSSRSLGGSNEISRCTSSPGMQTASRVVASLPVNLHGLKIDTGHYHKIDLFA
jgi:hypothetical protein